MVEHPHLKESSLSGFFLKLHSDQKTGVLMVLRLSAMFAIAIAGLRLIAV